MEKRCDRPRHHAYIDLSRAQQLIEFRITIPVNGSVDDDIILDEALEQLGISYLLRCLDVFEVQVSIRYDADAADGIDLFSDEFENLGSEKIGRQSGRGKVVKDGKISGGAES